MGSCCCKSRKNVEEIELSSATNVTVTCKCGLCGNNVKMKKDETGYKIEGKGTAIGSCALECDTGYWEVKIGNNPKGVCVGVKRFNPKKPVDLNTTLDECKDDSWVLKGKELKTGDVVGIYWDQTDLPMLSFAVNGEDVPDASYLRIRPANDVMPAVSVAEGSSCEMVFDGEYFTNPPKSSKFSMIVCASSLI